MSRTRNLNICAVISVFLLAIVGTSEADEKTIYHDVWQRTDDFATDAGDSNGPRILEPDIWTFHQRDVYIIGARADVNDPQGPNDIATVKLVDANGNEFILDHQGSGSYLIHQSYGSTPPPLGNTQIVAIDQSGKTDAVSEQINIVEELPTLLFPKEDELICDTQPVLDWADVTDEQSTITYMVRVLHQDFTPIWSASNLTESETQFNFDGTAKEALQDGMSYLWDVHAFDTFDNASYSIGNLAIVTPIIFDNVIILENDYLRIELHPLRPYVYRYVLKSNGEAIYGHIIDTKFLGQILYEGMPHDVEPSVESITQETGQICYHMRAEIESNLAVTFDLGYILNGDTVQVVFNNVTESPGYRLLSVQSPGLLTVRATQPGAKLVFPESRGRLIDIGSANPGRANIDLEQGGWLRPLLASMLYHDSLVAVAHYDHLDMVLWTRVIDHSLEGRLATIGMDFNYRYAPTNSSTAAFIDVFDSVTTELTVDLKFLADYDEDLDVDWMDGAKFLRDQVQATPDPRYLSSFITLIGVYGIDLITDYLRTIEELYHLTDHNKIHCRLLDHGGNGQSVFGVKEDLWPRWHLEELIEVFQEAEESYNTYMGFNDDYTNLFPCTPGYDLNLRVVQADGTPLPGWPTQGFDEVFVADPYDYATKVGIDRVRKTLERYPIKETHHIDAFSLIFHKDHSSDSPSSRERNRRGIQLIIDEFEKAGVDVTSEGLTGVCVDAGMGWFLDLSCGLSSYLPFGNEQLIPLLAFIYHGKALYGLHENTYYELPPAQVAIHTFLGPLLLGASSGATINWLRADDLEIDKFYLIDLPWMALNQRFMEDYQEQGNVQRITYDPDTFVEVDYEQNTYTVQVDGRIIAENYTTCFPKGQNRFLIFSRDQKQICVTLPEKWSDADKRLIELHALTEEGVGDAIPFEISDPNLTFSSEANTPYRLDLVSPGDFDSNKCVNLADFAIFALVWLTEEGEQQHNPVCEIGIPSDNHINWRDLNVLAHDWLAGAEYLRRGDFAAPAQDSNAPTILGYDIGTFHQGDNYTLGGWAIVHDAQGPNDIAAVKVIDANSNEFILDHSGSERYAGSRNYGSTPPPLGNTQIVAIDRSGKSHTRSENLTNVVEELPTMLSPKQGEVISEAQPVFDWADVTDDQCRITYVIDVCREDWTRIWGAHSLTKSEVQFNFDGGATDVLEDGMPYRWEVHALDTFGNASYSLGYFSVGTLMMLENEHLRVELHPFGP